MREDLQRFVDEEHDAGHRANQYVVTIDTSETAFDGEQRFAFLNSVRRWGYGRHCVKVRDYVVVFRGERGEASQFLSFLREEASRLGCDALDTHARSLVGRLNVVFFVLEPTSESTSDRMLN